MLAERPKPRREWLPLERLTFDPRLQFLTCLPGKLYDDEAAVERYVDDMEAGDQFPPLEAVEEKKGKTKLPTFWVFAGFKRAEAYRRRKIASVEVLVYPGTFADAEFFALPENTKHGRLRSAGDCRRAFDRLMDTPHLLARVVAAAKGNGGIHRAIAASCGIAKGVVGNYLKARGLEATREGKLVSCAVVDLVGSLPPEPTPEPEVEPETETAPETEPETSPARAKPEPVVSAAGDMELAGAKDTLAELARQFRSIGRNVESLLGSKIAHRFRTTARMHNLPFEVREEVEDAPMGTGNDPPKMRRIEFWPTLQALQAIVADVQSALYTQGTEAA